MRRLLQKRWVRILMRVLIGGITLLVLAVVIFNWQTARGKARAIAAARAAGLPLTLEEFTRGMPPDDQNFARIAMVRDWETFYAKRDRPAVVPGTPEADFELLADESYKKAWKRDREKGTRELDFASLPKDGPFGQTAESFLAEYERRNAKTIRMLQAGFDLPHVRRAVVPDSFTGNAEEWVMLAEGFGLKSRHVSDGLETRAEAALLTGDPGTAAESIELALRIADMVGSRGIAVSVMIEGVGVRTIMRPLRIGADRHLWRTEDLDRIQSALERQQIKQRTRQGIQAEVLIMQVWQGWKDDRSRLRRYPFLDMGKPSFAAWLLTEAPWLVPSGWFDMNAAHAVESTLEYNAVLDRPGPWIVRWREGQRLEREFEGRAGLDRLLVWAPAGPMFLKRGARLAVERQLMNTACELERYHLRHGSYPASLDAVPAGARIDPLHDKPFCYRAQDGKFTLYSIGPDEKDDGGVKVPKKAFEDQPDWIW